MTSYLTHTSLIFPTKVFLIAITDSTTPISPLLLVCKAANAWMLPFQYHSLVFTTSARLSAFLYTHNVPSEPRVHKRFDLIRNIHIGPISVPTTSPPSCSFGDLQYGSPAWPLTVLTRILWLARRCTRLVVLNLDQNKWGQVEHALPPGLTDLALGPTHGPFVVRNLLRTEGQEKGGRNLERFTSCLTYMRDEEVLDVVLMPSMRVVRRLVDAASMAPHWALEQAAQCVDHPRARALASTSSPLDNTNDNVNVNVNPTPSSSPTPKRPRMEIVLLGESRDAQVAAEVMEEQLKRWRDGYRDGRVVVVRDGRDWMRILFDEFEEFRVGFVHH